MSMNVGVVFPQTEIGPDPIAIRDYVQAAEGLGYSHLIVYDHVLGADTQFHQGWKGGYTSADMFHEPFVLFGYLAGLTSNLELVTAVLILGQRQTALVAKQAAEVDVLSGGRFRLGIGVGWNHVEYEALGQNFHDRGRRSEEQIALLRSLWTEEVVNFRGRWDQVTHAGINPLPVQRPIPIWMGAGGRLNPVPSDRVLRRVGRLADGWFPQFLPDETGGDTVARMRAFAKAAGRDPSSIGMEARINISDGDPEVWQERAVAWQALGATHVSVNTMRAGFRSLQDHLDAIQQFKETVAG
jgi:probable F420-dependent oxidoreductase